MFQLETLWYPPLWGPLIIAVHQPSKKMKIFSSLIGDKTHSVMVLLSTLSSLCLSVLTHSFFHTLFLSFSLSGKRRGIKESEGRGLVHMSDKLCSLSPFISLVWGLWLWNSLSYYQELASFSNHASQHYVWKRHPIGDIKKKKNSNIMYSLLITLDELMHITVCFSS